MKKFHLYKKNITNEEKGLYDIEQQEVTRELEFFGFWEGEDHDGCTCFPKKRKSKMPNHIKIYISNDKYGHHGNGKHK